MHRKRRASACLRVHCCRMVFNERVSTSLFLSRYLPRVAVTIDRRCLADPARDAHTNVWERRVITIFFVRLNLHKCCVRFWASCVVGGYEIRIHPKTRAFITWSQRIETLQVGKWASLRERSRILAIRCIFSKVCYQSLVSLLVMDGSSLHLCPLELPSELVRLLHANLLLLLTPI